MTRDAHHLLLGFFAALLCVSTGHAVGQDLKATGELGPGDDKLSDSGEFYDRYEIDLKAGELLDVTMVSEDVDAYLIVVPPIGESVENDDAGEIDSIDSRVLLIAPVTGKYEIIATTSLAEEAGRYEIEANRYKTEIQDRKGGSLSEDDEVSWKGGEYVDRYEIVIPKGERRYVVAVSDAFDAYLAAHGSDGQAVYSDDPAALLLEGGENGTTYTVVVTSYDAKEVGDYGYEVRSVHDDL
jgi:serine protease Do